MKEDIFEEKPIGYKITCDFCDKDLSVSLNHKKFDYADCVYFTQEIDVCEECEKLLPQKMINDPRLVQTERMAFILDCFYFWHSEETEKLPDVNSGIFSMWTDDHGARYFRGHRSMLDFNSFVAEDYDASEECLLDVLIDGMPQGAEIITSVEFDRKRWF